MSEIVESLDQIPDAAYYVLSDDRFMSDWGPAAGRTNTIILPCDDEEEAQIVADNANARTDMDNVRIIRNPPELSEDILFSLMTREDASRWYRAGGFGNNEE